MTDHEAKIGQEWTDESLRDRSFVEFMAQELGDGTSWDFEVLAAVNARAPRAVWEAILSVAHSRGRHAGGKCPERCPRF